MSTDLSKGAHTGDILLVEDNPSDVYLTEEALRSATRPNLILLDLNLPRKDGRPGHRPHDVERSPSDVVKCYDLHANCYIVKPVDFDRFETVIRAIEDFWFRFVTLPAVDP